MIDSDVHQNFASITDLLSYLPETQREHILHGGYAGIGLPEYHWTHPEGFWRRDSFPATGGRPGSDYETLRDQLLDKYHIDFAILTGEEILTASAMPSPHLAAALCSAYNDWLIERWLSLDPRLKGSIVVATQDPASAAEEIRRVGGHPDMVQVLLPTGAHIGYGHPTYHPIYEAAAELDLVVGIHVGGDGCGTMGAPTATGWPVYYIEWHTLLATAMMSHLVSLSATAYSRSSRLSASSSSKVACAGSPGFSGASMRITRDSGWRCRGLSGCRASTYATMSA